MIRSRNRNRTRKKYKIEKHRQTNHRRVRRTRRTRRTRGTRKKRKMKGGADVRADTAAAAHYVSEGGAERGGAGSSVDIKGALERSMKQYSEELGDNRGFSTDVDYNTLLCIEKIKALRPLEERRSTSIFMTTGYSYCYMFEEFIDEDYIMFCDWGIGTLKDTEKFILYGIARRNYELSNDLERGRATIKQVIQGGGISHWYSRGPLPMKTYIFLHMNLNDGRHIATLLETINSLGLTITTNNLSNVPDYIRGGARSQPYYRFFGDEPGIHPNCMYISGVYAYYFTKSEIVSILGERDMFDDIGTKAMSLSESDFGGITEETSDFLQKSYIHWKEFNKFWDEMYGQSDNSFDTNTISSCGIM